MTRVVGVESLILIEEVIFRQQPTVQITLFQINSIHLILMNVFQIPPRFRSQRRGEEQQLSRNKNALSGREDGVQARLAVERAGQVNCTTTGNTTHVVKLRAGDGFGDFPFLRELANDRLRFLVDLKLIEILLSDMFEQLDIAGMSIAPVLHKCS